MLNDGHDIERIIFLLSIVPYYLVAFVTRVPGKLNVSDGFDIALFITFGPIVAFFDYAGQNIWANDRFSGAAFEGALVCLAIMYLTLAVTRLIGGVYIGRKYQRSCFNREVAPEKYSVSERGAPRRLVVIFSAIALTLVAIALGNTESRKSLLAVYEWLFFQGTNELYAHIRRSLFGEGFVSDVLGRIRYSLGAFVFAVLITLGLSATRWRMLIFSIAGALLFLGMITPSKLTIFYYATLVALCVVFYKQCFYGRVTPLRKILVTAIASFFAAQVALGLLYVLQYSQYGLADLFGEPLAIANYRLTGIFFTGLLRYLEVYPQILPYIEGGTSQLLAPLLGVEFRSAAIEVASIWLGVPEGTTSNPVLFAGAGYADFGYAGVVGVSVLVGSLIVFANDFPSRVKDRHLRVGTSAVLFFSLIFLVQISVFPAMLSYGLVSVPIVVFALERAADGLKATSRSRNM